MMKEMRKFICRVGDDCGEGVGDGDDCDDCDIYLRETNIVYRVCKYGQERTTVCCI